MGTEHGDGMYHIKQEDMYKVMQNSIRSGHTVGNNNWKFWV